MDGGRHHQACDPLKLCSLGPGPSSGLRDELAGTWAGDRLAWCLVAGTEGTSEHKVGRLAAVWCQRASEGKRDIKVPGLSY